MKQLRLSIWITSFLIIMVADNVLAQNNKAYIKILKEVCHIKKLDQIANAENMSVYDQCLKYVVKNEFDRDITDVLMTIDAIDNSEDKSSNHQLTLKYEAIKYGSQLSKKFVEHYINYQLEKLLLELVLKHPKLLLNDLLRINHSEDITELNLHNFLGEFGYYLFSEKVEINGTFYLIDTTSKDILSKLVSIPSLKNELENFESYKLYFGEGAKFFRKKIFDVDIFYNVNNIIPMYSKSHFRIDTITISHYYPLHQWKDPLFLVHTLKSDNDMNQSDKEWFYLNRNIDRILE